MGGLFVVISERALDLAVQRGILSAEQAAQVLDIHRGLEPEPVDAEKLRFIAGFGDVFVTIGLLLFLGSIVYFAWQATTVDGWDRIGAVLLVVLATWALAEFFTRRRRMALPSIVLLLAFAAGVLALALLIGGRLLGEMIRLDLPRADGQYPYVLAGSAVVVAIMVAVHYWRFRVPVTVAVGAAALILGLFAFLFTDFPAFAFANWRIVLLACGIAVFVLAVRIDASDPARLTRRTDIAFWLHLLAAPLIVHTLIGSFVARGHAFDVPTAVAVLSTFLVLALVAVVIDRRAILVAGLTYAGVAFATLIRQTGLLDHTVPATFLALGAFVLLLSAGWQPLRSAIIGLFPRSLVQRLPRRGHPSSP